MEFVLVECTRKPEFLAWFLLLKTEEDVMQYLKHDCKGYFEALRSMRLPTKDGKELTVRLDHLSGNREVVLGTMLRFRFMATPEGEQVYPLEVIDTIMRQKAMSMIKYIMTRGTVQVNEVGGWSGHEAFLEVHGAKVVDRRALEKLQWPQGDPLMENVLILENSGEVPNDVYCHADEISQKRYRSYPTSLKNMKDKDPEWVAKSIANAEVLVFETQVVDMQQLDAMMELFSHLKGKEIHIKTPMDSVIKLHPLFEKNNLRHKIVFFTR